MLSRVPIVGASGWNWLELASHLTARLRVVTVCPRPTRSRLVSRRGVDGDRANATRYVWLVGRVIWESGVYNGRE